MNDITENGKYYTPSIEEFHVGFICEYLSENGIWLPTVIEADNYLYDRDGDYDRDNLLEIASPHDKTNFRVKRLCHEDILLCGWKQENTTGGVMANIGMIMYKLKSDKMPLGFNKTDEYVLIVNAYPTWITIRCGGSVIFSGTLNNINELRTIMKQVEI